jgi:hypothetical protein
LKRRGFFASSKPRICGTRASDFRLTPAVKAHNRL